MSLTAREMSWRLSWMAFAFGSLHPPQHVAQQLRSRREVPLRVRDVCMTQIRAQLWQMTLDIHPATVPLQKCLDGQPVAQPMQARSMRITWSAQANLVREFDECPSQHVIRHVSSTVGEKEPGTVGAATQAISEFCVNVATRVVWRGARGHTLPFQTYCLEPSARRCAGPHRYARGARLRSRANRWPRTARRAWRTCEAASRSRTITARRPAAGEGFPRHGKYRAVPDDIDGAASQAVEPPCADHWGNSSARSDAPSPSGLPIGTAVRGPAGSPTSKPVRW